MFNLAVIIKRYKINKTMDIHNHMVYNKTCRKVITKKVIKSYKSLNLYILNCINHSILILSEVT